MTTTARPRQVVVAGAFDNLRAKQIRFLEEAARLGEVTALLWPDELASRVEGKAPKFPQAERAYSLQAIRFVRRVVTVENAECRMQNAEFEASLRQPDAWKSGEFAGHPAPALKGTLSPSDGERDGVRGPASIPRPTPIRARGPGILSLLEPAAEQVGVQPDLLVVNEAQNSETTRADCQARGIDYRVLREEDLRGVPEYAPEQPGSASGRKKVLVTGCYDWVHSGHVRFFEEVSTYGDLYVVVGHDANIRLLKGPGHPLIPQAERRYVVGSIRHVTQALIATGDGWVDADPEVRRLKPDIYAVNEDGDRGGKREYCATMGIEYLVLKRTPAPGLTPRTSTDLRGF